MVPVTLLVPTFNAAPYLEACLDSVFAVGTPWPAQVVLVDDASTDNTVALARRLAEKFPALEVLAQPQNAGAAAARRTGLAAARCEWVALLDADDLLSPNALADALGVAQAQQSDVCVWQFHRLLPDGSTRVHLDLSNLAFPMTGRQATRLTLGQWKIHPLGVARRALYEKAYEGFVGATYNADELITRRLFDAATRVSVSKATYFYRLNPASTTQRRSARLLGELVSQRWLVQFAQERGYVTDEPGLLAELFSNAIESLWSVFRVRHEWLQVVSASELRSAMAEHLRFLSDAGALRSLTTQLPATRRRSARALTKWALLRAGLHLLQPVEGR